MSGVGDYEHIPEPNDDFKEVCIGEIKYARLIAAVREIDPEAADFLAGEEVRGIECKDFGFHPSDDLSYAFHWASTPQGRDYWSGLYIRLQERGYEGCRMRLSFDKDGAFVWG